ncbi:MAG: orotidine-5'-phosphate decarboxylase [Anaerolineae bacterium]|nr:orotidine-5'-phosphate decarboxylase [Anaerolineae bacterium]
MTHQSFVDKLTGAIERNHSLLCLGLDPDPRRFPGHFRQPVDADSLVVWGTALIEASSDLVCCYKPNFAFYEQYGPAGLEALRRTIAAVPDNIPILLDAKRGDIDSTAAAYARAAFEVWGADAVTVNPYLGRDGVAPFLAYPGKMAFVLCYTSNPSAHEIQEFGPEGKPLFEHVLRQAQTWGSQTQIGFVVGATQPHALARLRRLTSAENYWVLAPGVGTQGGDLAATLAAGLDRNGQGLIVPVSRSIIYAEDPRAALLALRETVNQTNIDRTVSTPSPSVSEAQRALILGLHELGCVKFGQFTLASGQSSPIYLDLRRLISHPGWLKRAAQAYAGLLHPLTFDHLAAVPYAALPLGTAVALTISKSLLYPRKEVKSYGTGKTIEGVFQAGERTVVLEDLVTSGGSVLKAIEPLKAAGLKVSDVVVLIDREQGGREALAAQGYRLHAVLQLSQILETLHQAGRISGEQVAQVKNSYQSMS